MIGFADADNFSQNKPAQSDHERRTKINGEKIRPGSHGAADTAVECPGCAVDCEGKCINVRVADDTSTGVRPFITVICDGKEQADIGKGKEKNGFCC